MSPQEFADYLSVLLGRRISPGDWVRLTSGQQARAGGWLAERGVTIADLRSRLASSFQPNALLDDATIAILSGPPGLSPRAIIDATPSDLRIGIDIQRVDELLPADAGFDLKASGEVTAMFTLKEISYAQSRPSPLDTLSGLFAAKEALRKCDAALLALPLREVEVLPDATGRPEFPGYSLSISHSGDFAIAVAAALYVRGPPAVSSPGLGSPPTATQPPAAPQSVKRFILKTAIVTIALLVGLLSLQWLGGFRITL
jgi:phosphopantetheinyl transferase (holo-ACP synthase)